MESSSAQAPLACVAVVAFSFEEVSDFNDVLCHYRHYSPVVTAKSGYINSKEEIAVMPVGQLHGRTLRDSPNLTC
jgi:hypothetical protein